MAEKTLHDFEGDILAAGNFLLVAAHCHATDDGTRNEDIDDDALLEVITAAEDRIEAALVGSSDMPHECSEALAEALAVLYLARPAATEPTALGELSAWRSKWMGTEAVAKYALQAAHRLTGAAAAALSREVAHG